MTPRPFQLAAMAACGDRFRQGARAVVLVSPTGSGKTVMGAMMVAALVAAGKRVAWGAHRIELVEQGAATLRAFGCSVGVNGLAPSAPVQVGMFQTWAARSVAPDADWFVADEAHHLADKTGWTDLQRAYMQAGSKVLGLTATPARGDGQALAEFDDLVVAAQIGQLQGLGLLVPLKIKCPGANVGKGKIAQRPVDAYLEHAAGSSAVVFSPHVTAAREVVAEFEAAGVRCKLVTGSMPEADRKDVLWRFHCGDVPVLVNCNVLTEGWDSPRCSTVIVARSCGSQALWIQMCGRSLRPWCVHSPKVDGCSCGKANALLLDLRGLSHHPDEGGLGRPDADRDYSLTGDGISVAAAARPCARLCLRCGAPLGDDPMCRECGKGHELVLPEVTGAELTDWQERYEATKAAVPVSRTALSLAGILRKAEAASRAGKPWKNGAVGIRFEMIFHRRPYPSETAAAENFNRATRNYQREAAE